MTAALVALAGGRSRRFGPRDKALAPVAGEPMLARVLDRLAPAVDSLVVNCRADQRDALAGALGDRPVGFAVDPVPDAGPVAGMRAGLAAADADRAFVVGCDMPFLDAATARGLLARVGSDPADAAVAVADGRRQPLGAAYRVAPARAACEAVGADGSLAAVLDRLDVRAEPSPGAPFRSVDTRAAAAEAARELGAPGGAPPASPAADD